MMRSKFVSNFLFPLLLLVAITALLWTSYSLALSYHLFGSRAVTSVFYVGALVSTAVLVIYIAANLILRIAFAWLLQGEATDLQRKLTIAMLTFIVSAFTLGFAGFNVTTILTTSAFLTAIVALSVQTMLSSLFAGLSIHHLIRIGDAVILDGEPLEIKSLHWRSVITRKPNGSTIVVPNSKLADGTLQLLAHDQPLQAEVKLNIASTVSPHRVRKLVRAVLEGFEEIDSAKPNVVLPLAFEPDKPVVSYQVQFWVRQYAKRANVEGRVLRRFWYAFQREGLIALEAISVKETPVDQAHHFDAIEIALRDSGFSDSAAIESAATALLDSGVVLAYDDGERINLPERLAQRIYVLLEGELSQPFDAEHPNKLLARNTNGAARNELTRGGWLALMEGSLARRIGPYASWAIEHAASDSASISEICSTVAREIDDGADRAAFLKEINPPIARILNPGLVFRSSRNAAQLLVSETQMQVVDHALILAVPSLTNIQPPKNEPNSI
jgi:small-conductance mechanosensitive channel